MRNVILTILMLLPISLSADIKIQNTSGEDVTDAYNSIWDMVSDSLVVNTASISAFESSGWPKWIEHDTTKEYIARYDTILVLYNIECDSSWSTFKRNDSILIKDIVVACDTIYRDDIRPVWLRKKCVILTGDELKKLMKLLNERD